MTVRVTWVQPEDLIGHELRQAAEDGRDVRDIERRWFAAGGTPAPERAGASTPPAPPALR
ncbi:ADP-ribosylglycohydrolase family protein, partial [Streptomyces sp. NPDC059744]